MLSLEREMSFLASIQTYDEPKSKSIYEHDNIADFMCKQLFRGVYFNYEFIWVISFEMCPRT